MNKTKIEWADYTWNPVTGCTRRCPYCYARRLANGRLKTLYLSNNCVAPGCDPGDPFAPRFWGNRLHEPSYQSGEARIFVVDMGDLWDPHIPSSWIKAIIDEARFCWWHTFMFLTKRPARASIYDFPPNAWVGITIEDAKVQSRQRLHDFWYVKASVRFISYEPLLGPIQRVPDWVDWIIIGAQTGPQAIKPKDWWVHKLILAADQAGVPVFLKDNLGWPEPRREWPKTREANHGKNQNLANTGGIL